jgi:small-conductance mechanosensitive channel
MSSNLESVQQFLDQSLGLLGDNMWLRAGVLLVAVLILAKTADWVITRLLMVWARKTKTDLDDRLIEITHRPVFLSVLLIGLWLVATQLDFGPTLYRRTVQSLLTIGILTWVVFAFRACTMFLQILSSLEDRYEVIQPRTVSLFDQVTKIVLVGGSIYLLFLTWDIDVGALLAAGGIVGIAVGFAAKDSLANLFSGIFILADAPYQVGDFVVLDSGERGAVTNIGLRSTRLLTRDDVEVTVPNAVIANAKIINESGGPWVKARIRVRVGVAYGSDIDHVRRTLMEVAQDNPDLDSNPEPRVRFRSFGESGLDFELLGWIHQPVLRGRVLDALNSEVYRRFQQESIEIPFPQRVVHLKPSEE